MKNINKNNKKKLMKILIFISTAILVLLLIIPQIIHFLVYTSSPFGFIRPGEESHWIGFFGSIIGGAFTLIGVIFTINFEKKSRYESEYPILIVNTDKTDYKITYTYQNPKTLIIDLKIKNVGSLEAFNSDIKIDNISSEIIPELLDNNILFLPKEQSITISIKFTNRIEPINIYPFSFTLTINYSGHKDTQYSSIYTFTVKCVDNKWLLQNESFFYNK